MFKFIIFILIIALLLYLRKLENKKQEQKKRLKQMLIDYPEIVSKLMVFVNAGLSLRQTWERICGDYEKSGKKRYAYDEMVKADNKLKSGMQESKVYRDFGHDCGCKQYMKLAGILEQNRRTGISDFNSMLSLEMIEAWEERKSEARRSGEEAGTRLLIPLVMMLAVVMIIIMAPAMMNM